MSKVRYIKLLYLKKFYEQLHNKLQKIILTIFQREKYLFFFFTSFKIGHFYSVKVAITVFLF